MDVPNFAQSGRLTRSDLYSLEKYAELRPSFRAQVIEHKKNRQVQLGSNARLYFEDRVTIQYQIQEMLRAERIYDASEIEGELEAYNPLVPDGTNWKATFMLEYPDIEERRAALAKLIGVEDVVWVKIGDFDPFYGIADEDLERETEEKTSSVHFLRFDLTQDRVDAVKKGAGIAVGCDHPNYRCEVVLPQKVRDSLARDLA